MNAPAPTLWRGPRWTLALLLACLGMVGPFAIDTYLPAFDGIAATVGATPVQMQQTLSAYLLAFALMNLFHGALADSLGRRPVVLAGIALFTLGSVGCALADSIGTLVFFRAVQGLAAGAGMVISRAIVRDLYPPTEAQRVMAQVTIFFGLAPAVAPLVGGWLFVGLGWRSIFWFLAVVGVLLLVAIARWLPESLPPAARRPFAAGDLLRGYLSLARSARFMVLVCASAIPFNGMFLYVLAAPVFLGRVLGLAPTQFWFFFVLTIAGIMGGAWLSGRMAGRVRPRLQMRYGLAIMVASTLVNVGANLLFEAHAAWALLPVAVYSFGWSLTAPVVTLLVLEQAPERRGMASSVQSSVGSLFNALVAGLLAPLVMHSALGLALAALLLMSAGWLAWTVVKRRVAVSIVDEPQAQGGGGR
jgi:DHA1 family bicyclomycin/chloramphenicol resistance-like MFS transporter